MSAWVKANPGQTIAYVTLASLAGVAAWAAWHYGGLPPFATGCAVVTRTGACPGL